MDLQETCKVSCSELHTALFTLQWNLCFIAAGTPTAHKNQTAQFGLFEGDFPFPNSYFLWNSSIQHQEKVLLIIP